MQNVLLVSWKQMTMRSLKVIEVDAEVAIKTCELYNYKYVIITSEDCVIPPKV